MFLLWPQYNRKERLATWNSLIGIKKRTTTAAIRKKDQFSRNRNFNSQPGPELAAEGPAEPGIGSPPLRPVTCPQKYIIWAFVKELTRAECWWGCERERMGLYITAAAMENDVEIPQKIKNRAATRPTKATAGHLSTDNRNTAWERYVALLCSLRHDLQQRRCGRDLGVHWEANEWNRRGVCGGILLSHKKAWDLAICINTDGPRRHHARMLGEQVRTSTDTTWFHLKAESKKKKNEQRKQKQTHTEKTSWEVPREQGGGSVKF